MRRFAVFIGVGIVCAIIDIVLMHSLILFGMHHVAAASAGFAGGLAANFALHTRVTFSARYSRLVLAKFMTVVLLNYLLTILFVAASFEWLGMALVGKIASLPVVAINGFLLSKHWVYR